MLYVILSLIIVIAAMIFALSNAGVVAVSFLVWEFEASLAFLLLSAFLLGVAFSLLLLVSWYIKRMLSSKKVPEAKVSKEQNKPAATTHMDGEGETHL